MVAQTYDGAAVMSGHLNGLQSKIKTIAPHAIFIHCYAHRLNIIFSYACDFNKESRVFFSNLSGFSSFFSKSPRRSQVLSDIAKCRLPISAPTRWNFTSRAVFTIDSHVEQLLEVFEYIYI